MTVSITEFITARLDEDEAAALGVLTNTGGRPLEQGRYEQWEKVNDTVLGDHAGHVIAYGVARYALPHIARHDPARTLREVAAKREILDMHAEYARNNPHDCTRRGYYERETYCWVIEQLAAPYSDHPDYNPEWSIT